MFDRQESFRAAMSRLANTSENHQGSSQGFIIPLPRAFNPNSPTRPSQVLKRPLRRSLQPPPRRLRPSAGDQQGPRAAVHGGVQIAGVDAPRPRDAEDRRVEPRDPDSRGVDRAVSGALLEAGDGRGSGGVGELRGEGGVDGGGVR